jgi:hypothetical protein
MNGRRLAIIGGVVVVALGFAAWAARDTYATARIGSAYVAKQTCSCLFVARRTPQSCTEDYDANVVRPLTVERGASSVTVSAIGGLLSAKAEFEEGFGCHLVN